MSLTDQNRPGVDTDIVQTQVVRGCDVVFPGDKDSKTLTIRGGDSQDGGDPGDMIIQPGMNRTSGELASITFLRRSTNVSDEIFILRASDSISSGPAFHIHGGTGDPNGSIFAPESSLYFDDQTPGLWIKTTNVAVNTGWEQLATVPVTAEDLEQTLILGNTTGALPIIVSSASSGIHGQDGSGTNGIGYTVRAGDSGGGNGGALEVRSGAVTSGTGDAGALRLLAGNSFGGATGGQGGPILITAGNSGSSFTGGNLQLNAGIGGPGVGGFGGSVNLVAGDGGGGGGGSMIFTAGDGGTNQVGGLIQITAGRGLPGGDLLLSSGAGSAPGGAPGGRITIRSGEGDTSNGGNGGDIDIIASDAAISGNGGNISLTPGLAAGGGVTGTVTVNGKLNVTGLIDPTGIIFTENSGDATDFPVPASEGGVYVSDGSNGRTDNALYYKDGSGNHYQLAPLPPGSGLGPVEAWLRSTWGYIGVNSDTTDIDSVGLLNGINQVTNGNGSIFRTESAGDGTPVYACQSGTTPNTTYAYVESNQLNLDLNDRFLMYMKIGSNTTSSNARFFAGLRSQLSNSVDFVTTDSAFLNTQIYIGFSTTEAIGSMSLVVANSGFKQFGVIAGVGTIDLTSRWLFIDTRIPGEVTLGTLVESGGELVPESTMTVDNPLIVPPASSSMEVLTSSGIRSGISGMSLQVGHVSVVTRADLIAQSLGAATAPLSSVLSVGNTMGPNPIIVDVSTPVPSIIGADNIAGDGIAVEIAGGNSTGSGGDGGDIALLTGDHDPSSGSARTGEIELRTADAISSSDSGAVSLTTGGADTGTTGRIVLETGDAPSGTGGEIVLKSGDADQAQKIEITAGDTSGVGNDAAVVEINGGNASDGKGGNVEINGGDATGGSNNPGGSIVLTPGSGFGGGADGVVYVAGKLTVTGLIDPTGLELTSVASVPTTVTGNDGVIWVNGSAELIYTNTSGDTNLSTGGGGGTPLAVQDEGILVDANVANINFTGAGVTATSSGPGSVTVNIPGGGGGGGGTAWECDTANTTNNTPQNLGVMDSLASDGEQTRVQVFVTAVDAAAASKVYYREMEYVYLRTGGTVSEVDRRTEGPHIRHGAFTTIEADLIISGNDIILQGTGESGTNINWDIRWLSSSNIDTACAGGGGGGGGESLAATLAIGNTTGGNSIIMSIGDSLRGADNASGQGGSISVLPGSSTGASGGGGNFSVLTGNPSGNNPGGNISLQTSAGAGTGPGGAITMSTGSGGAGTAAGGDMTINLGSGGGFAANGGSLTITTGAAAGLGTGGNFSVNTGTGGPAGSISFTVANSLGPDPGSDIVLTAGDSTVGGEDGGNIILNPGSGTSPGVDGAVIINGKLTVSGLIDPTGLELTSVGSVPTTVTGNDGVLWVNSSAELIYTNTSGDTNLSAGGGGSGDLARTLGLMQWANIQVDPEGALSADRVVGNSFLTSATPSGDVGSTGVFGDISGMYAQFGAATVSAGQSMGIFPTTNNRELSIFQRFLAVIKLRNVHDSDARTFVGICDASSVSDMFGADEPTQNYIGLQFVEGAGTRNDTTLQFVTAAGGAQTRQDTGQAPGGGFAKYLIIDCRSGSNSSVIMSLLDAGLNELATHTFTSGTPSSTAEMTYLHGVESLASGAPTKNLQFYNVSIIQRADLISGSGGGGGGSQDLASVLAVGNATGGGNDIVLTNNDEITGTVDVVLRGGVVSGDSVPALLSVQGSPGGQGGGSGGDVVVTAGDGGATSNGPGGRFVVTTGDGVGGTNVGGDIAFQTGLGPSGRDGSFIVGVGTAAPLPGPDAGEIRFQTNSHSSFGGQINFSADNTDPGSGSDLTLNPGGGGAGGGIVLSSGPGTGGPGGDVILTTGSGSTQAGTIRLNIGSGQTTTNGAGGDFDVNCGDGDGTGDGGSITMTTGHSDSGSSGSITLETHDVGSSASAGDIILHAGTTSGSIPEEIGRVLIGAGLAATAGVADGGDLVLRAISQISMRTANPPAGHGVPSLTISGYPPSVPPGAAAGIELEAGAGSAGVSGGDIDIRAGGGDDAGHVRIEAGNGTGTGNGGDVRIEAGTGSPDGNIILDGLTRPNADNTRDLGTGSFRWAEVFAAIGTINTSDAREKSCILDTNLGLEFINELRPVSYQWKEGKTVGKVHHGFLAQEVEGVLESVLGEDSRANALVHFDEAADRYGLRYTELFAPLVKAVQQLSGMVEAQAREISLLKAKIS